MSFTAQDLTDDKEIRDLLYADGPYLDVYLGEMEEVESTDKTTIEVAGTPRRVMSVWLATDTKFEGTNYFTNYSQDSFPDNEITLESSLPEINTDVVVAYYTECATCRWDSARKRGRGNSCAVCGGVGMTITEGTALSIPIQKVANRYSDNMEVTGESTTGNIVLRIKAEHEAMLRAAIKLEFNGKELVIISDKKTGRLSIEELYSLGVLSELRVSFTYQKF